MMFKSLNKNQAKKGMVSSLSNLQLMTLSFSVGKEVKGYRELPEFSKISADASLRAEPEETEDVTESSEIISNEGRVDDEEETETEEE